MLKTAVLDKEKYAKTNSSEAEIFYSLFPEWLKFLLRILYQQSNYDCKFSI